MDTSNKELLKSLLVYCNDFPLELLIKYFQK